MNMCIFCASIPAALAVGASANARQARNQREVEEKGEKPVKPTLPAGPATAVVVGVLVTASVVVHTQLS